MSLPATTPTPPPQTPAPQGLLSDERIAELAALLPYVTKGPWGLNGEHVTHHANGYTVCRIDGIESREVIVQGRAYPSRNGEFIVQAREWLPLLLGENADLRKRNALLAESETQNAREIAALTRRLQEAQQELAEQRKPLATDPTGAPDEIYLVGQPGLGGAAWEWVERMELVDGKVPAWLSKWVEEGNSTPPVRYVRATQLAPAASPVPEAAGPGGGEEGGVQG